MNDENQLDNKTVAVSSKLFNAANIFNQIEGKSAKEMIEIKK